MKHTVARHCAIAASSTSGVVFSSNTVLAPTDSGNSSRPPRPKVNASGGLPMKRSSAVARSVCAGQQAQAAITSRWKCMVPLGWPVVPEVNAIRHTSSRAVSTGSKVAALAAARAASASDDASLNSTTCASSGQSGRASSSSCASRASHSAWVTRALCTMVVSSRARSSGIVPTAMPPAFTTPNQQAASIGELAPRSSTRLPLTRPMSSTSTRAMRLACASSCGIGPMHALAQHALALAPTALDRAVEQLGGAIEARCELQLGPLEQELGPLLGRRQVIAGERVGEAGAFHGVQEEVDSLQHCTAAARWARGGCARIIGA